MWTIILCSELASGTNCSLVFFERLCIRLRLYGLLYVQVIATD